MNEELNPPKIDSNRVSSNGGGEPFTRFAQQSPECIGLQLTAGEALVDGDFEKAAEATNHTWRTNVEVPIDALPLVEIASPAVHHLAVSEVPEELRYWLQHPSKRMHHSAVLEPTDQGEFRLEWRGPNVNGLQEEMAVYLIGACTDPEGVTDWDRVGPAATLLHDNDFSGIPGLDKYDLHDDDGYHAEVLFGALSDASDNAKAAYMQRLQTLAQRLNAHEQYGEVGFTFSVVSDQYGNPRALTDLQVTAESPTGSISWSEGEFNQDSLGHTHPDPTPFSGADIRMIQRHPTIPHLLILGNGRGYMYQPGKGMLMVELTENAAAQPAETLNIKPFKPFT